MTMLDAALEYADQDFRVFPCKPDKSPYTKHGFKDATSDPDQVRALFRQHPDALIGLATGPDFWVLDEDDPGSADLLDLPVTRVVSTPSGGRHFYFLGQTKNTAKRIPGCDTRGDGGYVIAPPSPGYEIIRDIPMVPFEPPYPEPEKPTGQPIRYPERFRDELLVKLKESPDGTRNEATRDVAFALGQIHHVLGDTTNQILEHTPEKDSSYTDDEAIDVIQRAYRAGQEHPRQVEPPRRPQRDPGSLRYTELGTARLFSETYPNRFRFTPELGWLEYTGTHWSHAASPELAYMDMLRDLWASNPDTDLAKWLKRCESSASLKNTLGLAQLLPPLAASQSDFDQDPWTLNTPAGSLDLRDQTPRAHDARQNLTLCTPISPTSMPTPLWTRFLSEILPDPEVRRYLQRAVGYSATGLTSEQIVLFLYGTGANGKSVFIEAISHVLGPYAKSTSFDTFLERRPGQASNDLARLAGARLVRASEPDMGAKFSESMLKQITGGEAIPARFLYREYFEFQPQFTPWLIGNHKPSIKGTDHGIWRRIHLVPFTVKIPHAKRDKSLLHKLISQEAPGILDWVLDGATGWHREGLNPPPAVSQATDQYRAEEDVVGGFLEECTEPLEGAHLKAALLRQVYDRWCKDNGHKPMSGTALGRAMVERGYTKERKKTGWHYCGITTQAGQIADSNRCS